MSGIEFINLPVALKSFLVLIKLFVENIALVHEKQTVVIANFQPAVSHGYNFIRVCVMLNHVVDHIAVNFPQHFAVGFAFFVPVNDLLPDGLCLVRLVLFRGEDKRFAILHAVCIDFILPEQVDNFLSVVIFVIRKEYSGAINVAARVLFVFNRLTEAVECLLHIPSQIMRSAKHMIRHVRRLHLHHMLADLHRLVIVVKRRENKITLLINTVFVRIGSQRFIGFFQCFIITLQIVQSNTFHQRNIAKLVLAALFFICLSLRQLIHIFTPAFCVSQTALIIS